MPTYTDPGPISFEAEILREDVSNSQAFVLFPQDVLETYGARGRVPVNRMKSDGGLAVTRTFPQEIDDVWAWVTDPDRCGAWLGTWREAAAEGQTIAFTMTAEEGAPTGEAEDPRVPRASEPREPDVLAPIRPKLGPKRKAQRVGDPRRGGR